MQPYPKDGGHGACVSLGCLGRGRSRGRLSNGFGLDGSQKVVILGIILGPEGDQ